MMNTIKEHAAPTGAETLALLNKWNTARKERRPAGKKEWNGKPLAAFTPKETDICPKPAEGFKKDRRVTAAATALDPHVPSRANGFLSAIAPLEKRNALNPAGQSKLLKEMRRLCSAEFSLKPGERLLPELDFANGKAELWLFDGALNILYRHAWALAD